MKAISRRQEIRERVLLGKTEMRKRRMERRGGKRELQEKWGKIARRQAGLITGL